MCIINYRWINGKDCEKCDLGYYNPKADGKNCLPCHISCKECMEGKNTDCLSCKIANPLEGET